MLYTAGHFQLSLLKVGEKLQLRASHGEDREKVHTMLSAWDMDVLITNWKKLYVVIEPMKCS